MICCAAANTQPCVNGSVPVVRGRVDASGDAALTVGAIQVDAAFRKYSRYVAAMAYRMLRNREDVEDVVQEVFLDAVRGLARLRDEAAVRAWLSVVTIRNATQRRRIRATSVPYEFDEEISNELLFSEGDHERYLKLSAAAAVIQALPEQLRLPWVLHCLDGMALPGVAQACGCSVATVKRRIAQARTRLARA